MNNVTLIGRLTRDPEVRYSNDLAIARFSIAINRMPGRNGEDRGADFINIVVFGRQAENCERFIRKGSQVGIQGRIQTGSYQNKDGNTVYTTDVVADRVEFLGGGNRSSEPGNGANKPAGEIHEGFEAIDDEDIPF